MVGANLASRDLKAKTAAIVFDSSNDYSVGSAKAFRTQFLKNGGTIPIEVQPRQQDFKAQLASVKAKNVDMIYMPIYYTEGALIAVQSPGWAQQTGGGRRRSGRGSGLLRCR